MQNDQPVNLDLSSFPLLRIDQLQWHETSTLVESEAQLTALQKNWHSTDGGSVDKEWLAAIAPFVSKLLGLVRDEITNRGRPCDVHLNESKVRKCVKGKGADGGTHGNNKKSKYNAAVEGLAPAKTTWNTKNASSAVPRSHIHPPKRMSRIPRWYHASDLITSALKLPHQTHKENSANLRLDHRSRRTSAPTPMSPSRKTSSFIVSSPDQSSSSNFKSRAKLARASLKARSDEAISKQQQISRHQRTQQALENMRKKREERQKSKQRRQELFEEEQRLRHHRRKLMKEREERMRSTMHTAAEEAKSLALQSGRTEHEAVAEAAAAAARIVDEDSIAFHSSASDSLGLSFMDDDDDEYSQDKEIGDASSSNVVVDCVDMNCLVTGSNDQNYMEKVTCFEINCTSLAKKCKSPKNKTDQLITEPKVRGDEETGHVLENVIVTSHDHEINPADDKCFEKNIRPNISECDKSTLPETAAINCSTSEGNSDGQSYFSDLEINDTSWSGSIVPSVESNGLVDSSKLVPSSIPSSSSVGDALRREQGVIHEVSIQAAHEPKIVRNNVIHDHFKTNTTEDGKVGKLHSEDKQKSLTSTIDNFEKIRNTEEGATSRRFVEMFPTFSHIFAKFSMGGKATINGGKHAISMCRDTNHKDLLDYMKMQIERYTSMDSTITQWAKCQSRKIDRESDDSLEGSQEDSRVELERHGAIDVSCTYSKHGLFYRINSHRPEVLSILRNGCFDGFRSPWNEQPNEITEPFWNLQWTWGQLRSSDLDNLLVFQKVNRFRHTRGLTRKDLLKKNMQRFATTHRASSFVPNDGQRNHTDDTFNIMPLTFVLPHEYNAFVASYSSIQKTISNKKTNLWIIKPVGLSRGRGISLVNDVANVSYSQPIVIQRYIADPLLFRGYKFDLRIYVLVTSFNPLEAFIYKEGLARFGSRPFSSKPEYIDDHRIHLTNSSIQKEFENDIDRSHPAYLAGSNGAESKVALSWLWRRLESLGTDTKILWGRVIGVCLRSLIASGCEIPNQPNSFEIFGFDVMFDQQLKCWLIEINSSPSLGCTSKLDFRIKGSLIRDTLSIVDPPAYDREALVEICKRRLNQRKAAFNVSSGDTLEKDLSRILMNKLPRKYGQIPPCMGNFQRIAPGTNA